MDNNYEDLFDDDTQDYDTETSTANVPETVDSPRNVRKRLLIKK